MDAELLVNRILDDEGLTDGLNDPEARLFVEWLVARAEAIADESGNDQEAWREVDWLCKRARSIRQFVTLWCHRHDQGAAAQLAAAERFTWPLPPSDADEPCDILQQILEHEQSLKPRS